MHLDIIEEKSRVRELMLAKRKSIFYKEKRQYDKEICNALQKLILVKKPKVVHSYLPIKGEVDVSPLLKWLLTQQIKVVCPKVLPKRQLQNLELHHFRDFDIGPFRTIHPAGNKVYSGHIDFVIMPGLAFDSEFNRLGYGGGYYDRFLVKNPTSFKAAVMYPFQLLESVPVEEHDVKMDTLIVLLAHLESDI